MSEQDTPTETCVCVWAVEPNTGIEVMYQRHPDCVVHGDQSPEWKQIQARALELLERTLSPDEDSF